MQILINLISNAIKYSQQGKTVSVNVIKAEQFAEIQVIDEGLGIPPQYTQRIFDRFPTNRQRRREACQYWAWTGDLQSVRRGSWRANRCQQHRRKRKHILVSFTFGKSGSRGITKNIYFGEGDKWLRTILTRSARMRRNTLSKTCSVN